MASVSRQIRRARERKRRALALLDLVGAHLTPGTYFVDRYGHLRHVVHGPWSADVGRMKHKQMDREADPLKRLNATIRSSLAAVLPPTLVNVRGLGEPNLERELLGVFALATGEGNAVLLTRDGENAIRVYRDGRVPENEARLRPILERELALSPSRIHEGRGLIVEEYVRGQEFGRIAEHERERIFRELIGGYARLADKHASLWEGRTVAGDEERARSVAEWSLPSAGRIDWHHLDHPVPAIPSHGDVLTSNLLVRQDGSYTLIDYERCAFLPFYYDLLTLALRESTLGRHNLAAGLLDGRFDTELTVLWANAGSEYSGVELWRALSMAFLLHLQLWRVPRVVDWSAFD